jgi:hypothetical protein
MNHSTDEPARPGDGDYLPPAQEWVEDYDDRPTGKQLAYLRALAHRTGQTFAYPKTASQASREIRRLQRQKRSGRVERAIERREIADQIASGQYATDLPSTRLTDGDRPPPGAQQHTR